MACQNSTPTRPRPVAAVVPDYTTGAAYLSSRWYGWPALWRSAPPVNTELRFYDVEGSSQSDLWDAMLAAHLCDKYACTPDPGIVGGLRALALEGEIPPGPQTCYSPATFRLDYRHFILLPRWAPAPDGSVPIITVKAWDALLAALFTHEARHVAIAEADIASLNAHAARLPSCSAVIAFWSNPHVFDQLQADQNAYHAQLRDNCRPEVGCVPYGWLGWG